MIRISNKEQQVFPEGFVSELVQLFEKYGLPLDEQSLIVEIETDSDNFMLRGFENESQRGEFVKRSRKFVLSFILSKILEKPLKEVTEVL